MVQVRFASRSCRSIVLQVSGQLADVCVHDGARCGLRDFRTFHFLDAAVLHGYELGALCVQRIGGIGATVPISRVRLETTVGGASPHIVGLIRLPT